MGLAHSAYKGHADDSDVNALLTAYPQLKGTPMDSCATCHRSGEVPDSAKPGTSRRENHCDYCHVMHVDKKRDIKETLNRYGADYLAAGRGVNAVRALSGKDSDGDGFSNEAEFLKGTNPSDAASNPSARIAPYRVYTAAELRNMSPVISAIVLVNTTKSRSGDSYNEYRGNKAYEMLQAIGISDAAGSVDFIALDGYEKTFTIDELKKAWPQGAPVMRLSKKDLGSCGWVNYNAPELDEQKKLPSVNIILAFEENGKSLEKAKLDSETGRVIGAGPLRMIVPQFQISSPDLPQTADASCPAKVSAEYRFHENYDHNGGKCSSAIVAVRINPLPKGTRDFDWESVREQYISDEKIVFYGALKAQNLNSRFEIRDSKFQNLESRISNLESPMRGLFVELLQGLDALFGESPHRKAVWRSQRGLCKFLRTGVIAFRLGAITDFLIAPPLIIQNRASTDTRPVRLEPGLRQIIECQLPFLLLHQPACEA
jgi:hypothetical protein